MPKRVEEKLGIWNKIDNWVCAEGKTNREVVELLMKMPWNMTQSTAYNYLIESGKVFTMVTVFDKKMLLRQQFDKNLEYQRIALETRDLKTLALFEKNRILMIQSIPDEQYVPDTKHLQQQIFVLMFNPEAVGFTRYTPQRRDELYAEFMTPKNSGRKPQIEDAIIVE